MIVATKSGSLVVAAGVAPFAFPPLEFDEADALLDGAALLALPAADMLAPDAPLPLGAADEAVALAVSEA